MQPIEIEEKRPDFLRIDNMQDGKGGSMLLNMCHIISIRYFLYGVPSQPCLEIRMIDGSDIRISCERAEKFWSLKKLVNIWEYVE